MTVEKDADELVSTCTVKYVLCNRDIGKKEVAQKICFPIQRLVLVVPLEEQ